MNSTTQLVPTPRPDVTKRRLKINSYVVAFTSGSLFGLQIYMFIRSLDGIFSDQELLIILCSVDLVFSVIASTCAAVVATKKMKVAVIILCLISTLIALASNIVFIYFAAWESYLWYLPYRSSSTPFVMEVCACVISGILLIELIVLLIFVFMIWCRKNPIQGGAMNSAPVAAQQQIYIDAFPETQTQTNAYINAY